MPLTCPICHFDGSSSFYGIRSGCRLLRCDICGLVHLEMPAPGIESDFLNDAQKTASGCRPTADAIEYWSYPANYEKYRSVFDRFFRDRWCKITRVKSDLNSLLDIGCGFGFFVEFVRSYVGTVRGIDLDPMAAAYAAEVRDLPVVRCAVEDYDPGLRFDGIVMCDVLEHVTDPCGVLRHCHELLNPGGVILIQVPNLVGFRLPRGHSWGLPHHIWQFGPRSLRILLSSTGFRPSAWHTGVLGVIGCYERGGPTMWDRAQWMAARVLKIGNRLQMLAVKVGAV